MTDVRMELRGTGRLSRMVARAQRLNADLRPAWVEVDRRFTEREREQFESQGAITGGWPPLSPRYARQKARTAGLFDAIMMRSGRLFRSLVNPFDPNAVHEPRRQSYERGTAAVSEEGVPYPSLHQEGTGRLPQRETVVWERADEDAAVKALEDHVFKWLD